MSSKKKWKAAAASRDAGGFVAMPWVVLDSPAYQALSHPARGLLMEFARQYVRDNNGRLLASVAYLKTRGWKSCSVIDRAKKELIEAGFIYETAKGQRPSKASWYAVTWAALDRIPGYDTGAAESFQRGAYRVNAPLTTTPHPISKAKTMTKTPAIPDANGYGLTPPQGALSASTAPPQGVEGMSAAPPQGAVEGVFDRSSTPSHGDHLEKPSVGSFGAGGSGAGEPSDAQAIATLAELWERIGCRSVWRTIRPAPAPAARRPQQRKTARSSDRVEAGRRAMQQAVLRGGARAVNATVGRVGTPPQGAADGDGWTRDRGTVNEPEPWADW